MDTVIVCVENHTPPMLGFGPAPTAGKGSGVNRLTRTNALTSSPRSITATTTVPDIHAL